MKGLAMLKIGGGSDGSRKSGPPAVAGTLSSDRWRSRPASDVHTVWEGRSASGNLILGHEALRDRRRSGDEVKDFKPGDRVIVPAITPDLGDGSSTARIPVADRRPAWRLEVLEYQGRCIRRVSSREPG